MSKDSDSKVSVVFSENAHLFLPAVLLALIEIFLSHFHISLPFSFRFEYVTLFSILLLGSVPFSIVDPPVWFSIFMTTFVHMLYFKGFFYFSLLSTIVFFLCLTVHSMCKRKKELVIPVDV